MRPLRWTPLLALCSLPLAAPAEAHLMAPGRATLHVVGPSVYSVVWIPAAALTGVDTDGDGLVSQRELERSLSDLVPRLKARWRLRDGAALATPVRVDLVLQPPDDAPAERADQVVMLHHARFAETPRQVEVDTDLFGTAANASALTVNASGLGEPESATLRPPHAHHRFFAARANPEPPALAALLRPASHAALAGLVLVLGAIAGRAWRRRRASLAVAVRAFANSAAD